MYRYICTGFYESSSMNRQTDFVIFLHIILKFKKGESYMCMICFHIDFYKGIAWNKGCFQKIQEMVLVLIIMFNIVIYLGHCLPACSCNNMYSHICTCELNLLFDFRFSVELYLGNFISNTAVRYVKYLWILSLSPSMLRVGCILHLLEYYHLI